MTPEFDLIQRFFSSCGARRDDVSLGVGDDAALLIPKPDAELLVTHDTLVEGAHFFSNTDPKYLGHKSLAVNLSDLAAMGAEPAWVTLALTLPENDAIWLEAFSRGFCELAAKHKVRLVGGDTTRGSLSISIAALGWVPRGAALRRDGARPGDMVCVSGTLGDAGLALARLQSGTDATVVQSRLEQPTPRLELGLGLRAMATAAIDISDGLSADLGHILEQSGVGAEVELARIQLSEAVKKYVIETGDWSMVLSAGDDYELCFTVPPKQLDEAIRIADSIGCPISSIGQIIPSRGLCFKAPDGSRYQPKQAGFDHFSRQGERE